MNAIATYIPKRDILGRFIPSKTKIAKLVFVSLVASSLYLNYYLLKTFMVVKCADGGYFITKQYCNELAQNAFDSRELARLERIE